MRFDWYSATIQAHPSVILESFQNEFGAEIKSGRGLHGYDRGYEFVGPSGTFARMLAGGNNGANPHAWASGEDTDQFVELVRRLWPHEHTVSRMDSAEDFQGPVWDILNRMCLDIADEKNLKVSQAGDYHRLEDGRTLYVGSRKAATFIRLYEKGKQLRAKVTQGAEDIPADWLRLEAQIRPQKAAKKTAAYVSPEQAWGFSAWTGELARRCLELDVPRVQMHVWREADDDRAYHFMLRQYGPLLRRLCANLGDWACVGKQIGEDLK